MKIVFIGFGKNGYHVLSSLIVNKYNVICVITPKNYDATSVENIAEINKIKTIRMQRGIMLEEYLFSIENFDLIVVASYPYIISSRVISLPKYGALNVHGSMLPKYRGYHPIHWAIINNEKKTGVTVHWVDEGADTGRILAQKEITISNSDDINSVIDKVAQEGSRLLIKVLDKIKKHGAKMRGEVQKEENASYAPKRRPGEGKINWKINSREIFNLVRALKTPYPNAFCRNSKNEKIEIVETFVSKKPGEVLGKIGGYFVVATGDGVIMVKTKKKLVIGDTLK